MSDYLARCRAAVAAGKPLPEPQTLAELRLALLRYPRQAAVYRPSATDLTGMGLPANWCLPREQHDRDGLIASVLQDDELRAVLREVTR